jgi:undecaprenyl-diphosphatase
MDFTLFRLVNGLTGNALVDAVAKFLAVDLAYVLVALVAVTFVVPLARAQDRKTYRSHRCDRGRRHEAGDQPAARPPDRSRPPVRRPPSAGAPDDRSHDPSCPSDQATEAFALAFGIWLYDRTIGTALPVLAAVMSVARVFVGTHYPSDVVAGAFMDAVVATALSRLAIGRLMAPRVRPPDDQPAAKSILVTHGESGRST